MHETERWHESCFTWIQMLLVLCLVSLPYFLVLMLVCARLSRHKVTADLSGVLKGGSIGFLITCGCLVGAAILVERDEPFWWYGPQERLGVLALVVAGVSVLALVLGPVWGYRTTRRRHPAGSE